MNDDLRNALIYYNSGAVVMPTDLSPYEQTYGYDYLAKKSNSTDLLAFYNVLDEALTEFHLDTTKDVTSTVTISNTKYPLVAQLYYNTHNLTLAEAEMVYLYYQHDHPLFYWMDTTLAYNSKCLFILTTEDYMLGSTRAAYHEIVYEGIQEYAALVEGETSPYRIALANYDAIIGAVDYAYEEDGSTPQDDLWAHRVVGVFSKQGVVCEGFAKAFQLMLTYSDVENIYVCGDAGGYHAWNMVQLDDGEWYWFDATWDDKPNLLWGIRYNYFAVNDTQYVNWYDDYYNTGSVYGGSYSFISKHTPHAETGSEALRVLYTLPERSSVVFDHDDVLELRETFTVDGCTYAVVGYNKVQLISATGHTNLVIPETVSHDGITYKVISIGAMNAKGYFVGNAYVTTDAQTVTVPASVIYVWGKALDAVGTVTYLGGEQSLLSVDESAVAAAMEEFVAPVAVKTYTDVYFPDSDMGLVYVG